MNRAFPLAIIGIGMFCITDVLVKLESASYSVFQIAFVRYLFGTAGSFAFWTFRRPRQRHCRSILANSVRSVLVASTTIMFSFSLSTLPLADAVALSFLSPFFIIILGNLVLEERYEKRILLSVAIGFSGIVVIFFGQISLTGYGKGAYLGAVAAVLSALTYASNLILVRARRGSDAMETVLLFQNAGPALVLLPPAIIAWKSPETEDLFIFAVVGFLGLGCHILLITAYSKIKAARLAPTEYTALLWAELLGYAVFHEIPRSMTILGSALIFVGTVIAGTRRIDGSAPEV
nr:DMT family transporter [Caballeronia udeis]